MVLIKLDNRIRSLIESGIAHRHRSLFVIIGDKARDQVVTLHHVLTKANTSGRPSVSLILQISKCNLQNVHSVCKFKSFKTLLSLSAVRQSNKIK